jgi:hypothetical protein
VSQMCCLLGPNLSLPICVDHIVNGFSSCNLDPRKMIGLPLKTCYIVLIGQLCWPWIVSRSLLQIV